MSSESSRVSSPSPRRPNVSSRTAPRSTQSDRLTAPHSIQSDHGSTASRSDRFTTSRSNRSTAPRSSQADRFIARTGYSYTPRFTVSNSNRSRTPTVNIDLNIRFHHDNPSQTAASASPATSPRAERREPAGRYIPHPATPYPATPRPSINGGLDDNSDNDDNSPAYRALLESTTDISLSPIAVPAAPLPIPPPGFVPRAATATAPTPAPVFSPPMFTLPDNSLLGAAPAAPAASFTSAHQRYYYSRHDCVLALSTRSHLIL